MSNNDVPIWEKYTLTIEEASKYFRLPLRHDTPAVSYTHLDVYKRQSQPCVPFL